MTLSQDNTASAKAEASTSNTVNGTETEELIAKIQNLGQSVEDDDDDQEDNEDNEDGEEKEGVNAEGGDGNSDKKKKKKKKKGKTSKAVDRLKYVSYSWRHADGKDHNDWTGTSGIG